MRKILLTCLLALAASPVAAQMISRPTDAPAVSAVGQSWYELREPILYAGEAYYPAGATVFFNANHMVRTGHYNGVPLYADATRDPYSVVYVPIGGGQLRPYERLRRVISPAAPAPRCLVPDALRPAARGADGRRAPTNPAMLGRRRSAFTPEVTPPVVFQPPPTRRAPPAAANRRPRRSAAAACRRCPPIAWR
jgi:hypothetical protein